MASGKVVHSGRFGSYNSSTGQDNVSEICGSDERLINGTLKALCGSCGKKQVAIYADTVLL